MEKPIDAEDHNVYVYYPQNAGGGSKRLVRGQVHWSGKVCTCIPAILPFCHFAFLPACLCLTLPGTDARTHARVGKQRLSIMLY